MILQTIHLILKVPSSTLCSTLFKEAYQTILEYSYREIQQDPTVHQNLLFHIYTKLNMFRATHRPSSGA
jgi:hypothetical protein